MSRALLSGNEAVARGAWQAGAAIGVGYPGTPSTEVLENFVQHDDVRAEWAPNEKVALEVAIGVSLGGQRVLVTMKHVGLNVAADPLMTLAYTGVRGGLVILVADDPGMHSSQNEQDSRRYAAFARVPVFEPSDSQEALEFTAEAFDLSERFDTPVLVRTTTRISHSKSLVEVGERFDRSRRGYDKDARKYVMVPANARVRRTELETRLASIQRHAEECPHNRIEMRGSELGVVTSGVAYQYVREALPEASVLKLGLSFPFPADMARAFASSVSRVAVVEELDPVLRESLALAGIEVASEAAPAIGELSPGRVGAAFGLPGADSREAFDDVPPRPPLLCPGCPHRAVFHALRKMRAIVMGDIGCYTLGALPPLASMDSCVCMGASIGMAHGLELAGEDSGPVVGVIGDSTFAHSGITGLDNIVYNGGHSTIVILDNRTTAMTGHQGNPVCGRRLQGGEEAPMDLEALCGALGVGHVVTVDAHDLEATEAALRAATAHEGASVVIAKAPCALLVRMKEPPHAVDEDACTACGACVRLGCPAISKNGSGKATIDISVCVGCGDCVQVCRYDAIVPAGPACDVPGGVS